MMRSGYSAWGAGDGGWVVYDGGGYPTFTQAGYGGSGWLSLMKQAVRAVVSGESTEAVKRVVLGDEVAMEQEVEVEGEEKSWGDTWVYDWKYGPSGFWPKSQEASNPAAASAPSAPAEESKRESPSVSSKETKVKEKWDARTATNLEKSKRRNKKAAKTRQKARGRPAWLDKLLLQCKSHSIRYMPCARRLTRLFSRLTSLIGILARGDHVLHQPHLWHLFLCALPSESRNGSRPRTPDPLFTPRNDNSRWRRTRRRGRRRRSSNNEHRLTCAGRDWDCEGAVDCI